MARLLVSVRTPAEAETALAGGAHVIDVKEPRHGALGRAADATIAAVVATVAGRAALSAALGELTDGPQVPAGFPGLVKVGLAGCAADITWPRRLAELAPAEKLVAVAYADWERAVAPPPAAVLGFAVGRGCAALLVDTWGKDGRHLLDWLPPDELAGLIATCRGLRLPLALAGALTPELVGRLPAPGPDVVAVRGAACVGGREGTVDQAAVRRLAELVAGPAGDEPPGLSRR